MNRRKFNVRNGMSKELQRLINQAICSFPAWELRHSGLAGSSGCHMTASFAVIPQQPGNPVCANVDTVFLKTLLKCIIVHNKLFIFFYNLAILSTRLFLSKPRENKINLISTLKRRGAFSSAQLTSRRERERGASMHLVQVLNQ